MGDLIGRKEFESLVSNRIVPLEKRMKKSEEEATHADTFIRGDATKNQAGADERIRICEKNKVPWKTIIGFGIPAIAIINKAFDVIEKLISP